MDFEKRKLIKIKLLIIVLFLLLITITINTNKEWSEVFQSFSKCNNTEIKRPIFTILKGD